jgi:hypothetical protein
MVDDPYSQTGGKIAVTVSLRDDPLGTLYADNKISQPQFEAGERLREQLRKAEFGVLKAADTTREPVDGRGAHYGGDDQRLKAYDRVKSVRDKLGPQAFALVRDVLSGSRFLTHPADIARLAAALDTVAATHGLQMDRGRPFTRHHDKYSEMAKAA